ncbi:MAG: hypothetical protein ACK5NA_03125 [Enterococcus sp.]
MVLKEKINEMAEKVYDVVKSGKYDVEVHLPKKEKKVVRVKTKRQTAHAKKWSAKIR